MPSHVVRVLCEARSQSRTVRDAATGETPFAWRGSDLTFQLGLTDNGQHLLRAAVGTIVVEVKALGATSADDSLMRKEFVAADCDPAFTAAAWEGGAQQLLAARFTKAEAALPPGSYRFIVRHLAGDGTEMTYISTEFRLLDPQSGSEGLDAPPVAWSYLDALPVVRTDIPQSLSPDQQAQARENIGIGPSGPTYLNVIDLGVVADGQIRTDGVAVAGDNTITSSTGNFPSNIVGKYFRMEDVGVAGADLIGIITARNSPTSIEVSAAPSSSATGKTFIFGTDNTIVGQDLIDDCYAGPIKNLFWPPGIYIGNFRIRSQVGMFGCFRGNVLHGLPNPTNLADRQVIPTALLPAVSTLPVIYGDVTNGGVFGCIIQGFSIVGSAKRTGYGIKLGEDWGYDAGPAFGNIRTVITHCNTDGFNVGIATGNAVDGEVSFSWANNCNYGFQYWKHDGLVMRNCSSTTTGTTIRVGGSKNVVIPNGNYNWFDDYWLDNTDSQVSVGTVNIEEWELSEAGTNAMSGVIAIRQVAGSPHIHADYINVLATHSANNVVLVRNFVPEATKHQCSVFIAQSVGATHYDTANTRVPFALGGLQNIRYYADNTFATLRRTERVRRVYATPRDLEDATVIRDEFMSRLSASPYGDMGWVITNVSGTTTMGVSGAPRNAGKARVVSSNNTSTNVARLAMPNIAQQPLSQKYWRMKWKFNLETPSTAVQRMGVYSLESALKPQNGIGIRVDTSGTPDTTVKLEILSAGTSLYVVDTGVAIGLLSTDSEVTIERTKQGVRCLLTDYLGNILAPEVWFYDVPVTSPLPAWNGIYMSPAVYSGVSTTAYIAYNLSSYHFIEYPTGVEWE